MRHFEKCVTLIGCGGIGGAVALQVARLIPLYDIRRFILYDFDAVEERNLEGQIYTQEDMGQKKVAAIQRHLSSLPLGECVIEPHTERVDENTSLRGIVIVAVDNLETRQHVFRALDHKSGKGNPVPLLIEARVDDEHGLIYILCPQDPDQMARYHPYVFWEEEPNQNPDDRCVPARIGALFGGTIAQVLVEFWAPWQPLSIKLAMVSFGSFPEISFTDLA